MKDHSTLKELLHNTKISDIVDEKNDILYLKSTDTVDNAIKIMSENKYLSVPVLDGEYKCLGYVDLVDIIFYVLDVVPDANKIVENELKELETANSKIHNVKLEKLVNYSKRNTYMELFKESSLLLLAKFFQKGFHRTAISNTDIITNYVSQSDLVKFIKTYVDDEKNKNQVKDLVGKSMTSLGYGTDKPVCIESDQTVLYAISLFKDKKVQQVAVIDKDSKKLIGNFSASDLRGLYQEKLPRLLKPIGEFLEEHSPNSLKPVVITTETTPKECLDCVLENKLHHIWVIEHKTFKPVGIVTLTDIISCFVNTE